MKTVEVKRLLRWGYPVLNLHCPLLCDEKTSLSETP